ncbi:MAG: undecaprenyldiphospho-muramoylpentapeptide beta-N-acetylglucosaminyltransferase [Clostridia bacterium]|nr:undecaprenyldiphospho-muramoylpentapeptide beta-N-acetylglucosaminyltransferase [Clostridia bacterium]
MRVIIAAAGTGGHINPGIAIANKIKQEENNSEILFIGTTEGLENDLVPRAGFDLKPIEAYGFNRKITIRNIKRIIKTLRSKKDAKKILQEFKPDIVIGTGGYICMPVFLAAISLKIHTALHESNAFPGASVKALSGKVDEIFVGFEDAKKRLPKAKKVVVTGTPTKVEKMELSMEQKESIKSQAGLKEDLPVVLAFGGSQGARSINEALMDIIRNHKNEKYQLIWAAGQSQYDIIKEKLEDDGLSIQNLKNAKIVPYIYNMGEILNMCDLVVARSGAMTITELAKVGKPGIFIPLPYATENHQEYNARVLADVGAGKIILDKDLNESILSKEIDDIISNPEKLKKMGEIAKQIEVKNVEGKIYEEIKKIVG